LKKQNTKFSLVLLVIFFLLAQLSFSVFSQQLDSSQIKSAYLYNFIKHINWPNDADRTSYTLAVYDDDLFYRSLSQSLSNRKIKGKSLRVTHVSSVQAAKSADLLFIANHHNNAVSKIASQLRSTATLLITDNSTDLYNVMINLVYNNEDAAISFEVNKSNIVYEQLKMSTELLLLGGTELDVATLYREIEVALQVMRNRESALNKKLLQQELELTNSSQKLVLLNKNLKKRTDRAVASQNELVALKLSIDQQYKFLKTKELQYTEIVTQLNNAKKELQQQQGSVQEKEDENMTMANRIEKNKAILEQQQKNLTQQNVQISEQNKQLEDRNETINQQHFYIVLMIVLILISILGTILVVFLFIKNKKTTSKLSITLENLKNMQDQLVQSEKMASLGTLTAGVAHEINTPLGIAVTSTSSALESTNTIKEKFEKGELTKSAMTRYFEAMTQSSNLNTTALERVIELLSNFKQVAADQVVGEKREIEMIDYIKEVMSTLSAELKKYRINYHYTGLSEINITTIPGPLAQVLTNLVTNSIKHGFEGRTSGNINITVDMLNKDSIKLVYQDDGLGMSDDVLDNIYEPFFTTKRNCGGTGLGMNIVYNIIVQKLKGTINIDSLLETGTTTTLTLPISIED
jgi:signal transduction histidine kinase